MTHESVGVCGYQYPAVDHQAKCYLSSSTIFHTKWLDPEWEWEEWEKRLRGGIKDDVRLDMRLIDQWLRNCWQNELKPAVWM